VASRRHQVGWVDAEAAGDLNEHLHRPVKQRRVQAADQVWVDAGQVTQLPRGQPGIARPPGQRRTGHGGPLLIHPG